MNNEFKTLVDTNPLGWLRVALYCVLLYLVFHTALGFLFFKWQDEDFTYCYMVPFIILYLLWEKREKLAKKPSIPSWKGLVPVSAGILLYLAGELASEFTLQFLSLWLVAIGLCWLHLGWDKLKVISFPLVFSLAMFIPPNALYAPVTLKLKLLSSQLGVKIIQLYGLSAYREGNVIDLGFTRLQVVDACSGLRYVIPLILMGILLAYYYREAFWKRTLLVLSTIPLSIITNSLRIASVGILYQYWGPAAAEGFFHDFSGWFIFMASLAILLAEMWLLKKVFPKEGEAGTEAEDRIQENDVSGFQFPVSDPRSVAGLLRPLQFPVAVVVLIVTIALGQMVNFHEKTPIAKSLDVFPLQVGDWRGNRTAMEQQFLDALKLSDYATIDYRDGQGRDVSFYVAYNSSQSKGESTHSPATCLPYSGWEFKESGTTTVTLGGREMRVCRAFIEKNGVKQLTYYWFPQRGRTLTSLYQIKLYNFWDALTRQRTDGALVRIITPMYGSESLRDAEQRLQGFTREMVPVLSKYLPQ